MSRKQNIRWLLGELSTLVAQGILPADAAERIRRYYGEREEQAGRRWPVVLFSVVGAALVGSGAILLLAHNWDQFSRGIRTALSYAPMIVGQLVAAWVLFRRNAGAGRARRGGDISCAGRRRLRRAGLAALPSHRRLRRVHADMDALDRAARVRA